MSQQLAAASNFIQPLKPSESQQSTLALVELTIINVDRDYLVSHYGLASIVYLI